MGPDLTVVWDDALCERFATCIECGRLPRHIDLVQVQGRALAVSRCARCFYADREAVHLIARLARRATTPAV